VIIEGQRFGAASRCDPASWALVPGKGLEMKTYGLLLRRTNEYGTERVEAYVVCREAGKDHPYGCSSDGENSYDSNVPKHLHGLQVDGLGMYGFVSDCTDQPFIGHEAEFRNIFAIDMAKAARIAKTLKRVLARIQKDSAYEPGDRLVSLAAALKLSFVVERKADASSKLRWSSNYSENDWRWMTIPEGRDRYRQLIAEAVADVRKAKGLAA